MKGFTYWQTLVQLGFSPDDAKRTSIAVNNFDALVAALERAETIACVYDEEDDISRFQTLRATIEGAAKTALEREP